MSQEKLKTMIMQNFGGLTKTEQMVASSGCVIHLPPCTVRRFNFPKRTFLYGWFLGNMLENYQSTVKSKLFYKL